MIYLTIFSSVGLHASVPNHPTYVESIKSLITQLSVSKKITFEYFISSSAEELRVLYLPEDEDALRGPAGISYRAMITLANELSIAHKRDETLSKAKSFEITQVPPFFLRYQKK